MPCPLFFKFHVIQHHVHCLAASKRQARACVQITESSLLYSKTFQNTHVFKKPLSPAVTPAKKNKNIFAVGTTDTSWNMPLTKYASSTTSINRPCCRIASGAVCKSHKRQASRAHRKTTAKNMPNPTNPVSVSSDKTTLWGIYSRPFSSTNAVERSER